MEIMVAVFLSCNCLVDELHRNQIAVVGLQHVKTHYEAAFSPCLFSPRPHPTDDGTRQVDDCSTYVYWSFRTLQWVSKALKITAQWSQLA